MPARWPAALPGAVEAGHALSVVVKLMEEGRALSHVCKLRLEGDPCCFPSSPLLGQLPPEQKHLSTEGFGAVRNPHGSPPLVLSPRPADDAVCCPYA
jgi:hypothetical protein